MRLNRLKIRILEKYLPNLKSIYIVHFFECHRISTKPITITLKIYIFLFADSICLFEQRSKRNYHAYKFCRVRVLYIHLEE